MKRWTTFLIMILGGLLLGGCGSGESRDEFYYEKTEEKTLALEQGLCGICFKENYAYSLQTDISGIVLRKEELLSGQVEETALQDTKLQGVLKFVISDKGDLYVLKSGEDDTFQIECFREDGSRAYEKAAAGLEQTPNKFGADPEGNLVFWTGNKLLFVPIEGETHTIDEFLYITDLAMSGDCCYVAGVTREGRLLCTYDPVSGQKLEDYTRIPDVASENGLFYSEDHLIVNSSAVLSEQKKENEELLQLVEFGIDGADLRGMFFHEEKLGVVCAEQGDGTYVFTDFEKKKGKRSGEEMTIAGYYIDSAVKQWAVDYNKSSEDMKIRLKDYSEYDYLSALDKMNVDMVSKNAPDIILLSSFNEVRKYAQAGMLADLSIQMEEYEQENELLLNVLDASRLDGQLYAVMPCFSMRVIVGKNGSLAESFEFDDLFDSENQGSMPLLYAPDSETFLICSMISTMDDYIDYAEKKCEFHMDRFEKLLMQARHYQNGIQEEETLAAIKAGEPVLMSVLIGNAYDMQQYYDLFGENLDYWGNPCADGNKILIQSSLFLGICKETEHFDEAWAFIEETLSEESQRQGRALYTPIRKSTALDMAQSSGNPQYPEGGNETIRYSFTFGSFSDNIIKTESEARELYVEMLQDERTAMSEADLDIWEIITEESAYYLNGSKPFAEVADSITNRVNLLLAERY